MNTMRPVNERLPPEAIAFFSGPMAIPSAIASYHRMGSMTRRGKWSMKKKDQGVRSTHRDPIVRG